MNDNRVGFIACQKEKCIDVTIVDDAVSENKEQFNVHMRRTPDHGRSLELVKVQWMELLRLLTMTRCVNHYNMYCRQALMI